MIKRAGQNDVDLRGTTEFQLVERGRQAFVQLLKADTFACEFGRSVWEFAINLTRLQPYGLTSTDIRWLVCKGLLKCANETKLSHGARTFEPLNGLKFSQNTSCVLTDAGIDFVRHALVPGDAPSIKVDSDTAPVMDARPDTEHCIDVPRDLLEYPEQSAPASFIWPEWNDLRRELRMDGKVVKRFRVPAPNQETILRVFEEENWPERIDDPLPQTETAEPKRRLHDTINALNRNQRNQLV
ncbi:MAG: hypothetical protein DWQ29_11550, partial [Planctomycetota bacterium]